MSVLLWQLRLRVDHSRDVVMTPTDQPKQDEDANL